MKTQLTLLAAAVMLAGCGGSGGSDESAPTYTLSGTVKAQSIQGNEKVCADLNQDFVCGSGEPSTTASNGQYSITSTSKAILENPIVVEIDTGSTALNTRADAANQTAILVAPAQNKLAGNDISAVSTLVAGYVASGESLARSVARVESHFKALGLPSDEIMQQVDDAAFQTLEKNILTLTSAMEESNRNDQVFALAVQLDDQTTTLGKELLTDQSAKAMMVKLASQITLSQIAYRDHNDTGITSYVTDGGYVDQSPADYPGQDADFGHDKNDGGFKFMKLDASGKALSEDAAEWSCVQDQRSGLIWESKLDNAGSPRHFDRLFAYQESGVIEPYIEDINILGCRSTDNICTTEEYVNYLNKEAVCGITNWRLPTSHEVYNLIDFGETETDADNQVYGFTKQFFPLQSKASYYETGVIWTKFASFSEYSDQAAANGHFFNAIETRGEPRGSISPQEIYTSETPTDNSDSYQFAVRLVAYPENK